MKRSMFLDLCVSAAMLSYDKSGKAVHRAILRDASKHNCLFYCPLAKVQEVEANAD